MLDESEIKAILGARKVAAENYTSQEAKESRDLARHYFDGELFGDEVKDRSQVILTVVRDKINAAMPSLMKVFTSGDRVVTFRANRPQDVKILKNADRRVNSIVMEENEGFRILYTWFFDALLEKNGIVTAWLEDKEEVEVESLVLAADTLDALESNDTVEVVSAELQEGEEALFDVEIRSTRKSTVIRVDNVAPENFGIDPSSPTILDTPYCFEERMVSRSDLIAHGYDEDVVKGLPSDNSVDERDDGNMGTYRSDAPSELIRVTYHYLTIDADEDGKAERRHYVTADDANVILSDEEWSGRWPYFDVTPVPRGHEFYGISMAEEVMDLQLIESTLLRMYLDNLYGTNSNRLKVFETSSGQVNMDDVLNKRVDSVIRIRSAPGGSADVQPMPIQPIGDAILPAMNMLEEIGEVRTGVSKFGQGLNPDVLHKTPATTAGFMMTSAQEKQALIARIFAETGVKHLFKYVYDLERKNGRPGEKRVGGGFAHMDPSQWPPSVDAVANVGLGTGNKQQQAQNVMGLIALMERAREFGVVSPTNGFNALEEAVDAFGYRHVERFFTDPDSPEGHALRQQMEQARQQAQQSAEQGQQALIQIEQQKVVNKREMDIAKLELDVFKVQSELKLKEDELTSEQQLDMQQMIGDWQLKILELRQEGELEGMELGLEANLKRQELAIQAMLENKKVNIDTNIRDPNPV